ncbi:MAG: winged helix-turn-helix transcriptional regulator [Cytophagales bacterium]|nr:winged helix-turn-helix transcriptional regulator [Cytophagales bacterium]
MDLSNSEIDNLDLKILSLLMEDATSSYTDIAKIVSVSPGTVHFRMKKLEAMGVVKKSQLVINYSKIGYDITAFVGIYLKESSMYEKVVEELIKIPQILNMNYTTGNYSIFAKLICKDTQHLMNLLHGYIQKISGIERTETFISLHESINRQLKLI